MILMRGMIGSEFEIYNLVFKENIFERLFSKKQINIQRKEQEFSEKNPILSL